MERKSTDRADVANPDEVAMNIVMMIVCGLVSTTLTLAVIAWMQIRFADGELRGYEVFPLLGLVAFSLMWTHYIVGSARRRLGVKKQALRVYSAATSWVVLVCLILHPTLLAYELWRDGLGLPPLSIVSVYSSGIMPFAIIAGSMSLTVFLAFELHRWFRDAAWWKYVEMASVVAMGAIFWHGLQLGGEINTWYRAVWIIYAVTLVVAIVYNHKHDKLTRREL